MRLSAGWYKKCVFVVLCVTGGILFDHFVLKNFGNRSPVIGIRGGHRNPETFTRGPSSSHPRSSKKKELDRQFKDYLPRLIFINCGGSFPLSVQLFLDTYPQSLKYTIFSFIPEISYKPLYSVYRQHTFIPAMCGTSHETVKVQSGSLTDSTFVNKTVNVIDISAWILENTHPDEYIILKLDLDSTKVIPTLEHLGKSDHFYWINKLYIRNDTNSSRIGAVLKTFKETFRGGEKYLGIWDDNLADYSDLKILNPPRGTPLTSGRAINKCKQSANGRFALILYATEFTPGINDSITIVLDFIRSNPITSTPGLFLSLEYFRMLQSEITGIYSTVNGGLWYNCTDKDITSTTAKKKNVIRNDMIKGENIFNSSGLVMKSIFNPGINSDTDFFKIAMTRNYNVYHGVRDISLKTKHRDTIPDILKDVPKNKFILAVNMNEPQIEMFIINLLTFYRSKLIDFKTCGIYRD
ncbi:uncharacterized protein LOC126816530 [Patella vulgata]|uniref:uncharacterized protein LOC126816530 n=1 Tax=Patella vulgata TaxID=6465 RepID=UPI0024A99D6E|nr:uncharacterized protein LOC126816530 [Patella vulgata]